ncbi:MAG: putative 4-hydroxy-4-methyl-2-oxoglutarate aldolase, partial [Cellvibrionaceae bacterium]|nr:putative 4-hydroxy-4-methyl-2-oxoglutarate aldolase [Cellvibrionaceae bacterium]
SLRKALLGDMIAENAVKNGWEGIIIYGCIRDAAAIAELDLGVQALGTIPLKTEKRGIGDLNIPINFGGVDFIAGEYVYADCNGVVVSAEALSMPE